MAKRVCRNVSGDQNACLSATAAMATTGRPCRWCRGAWPPRLPLPFAIRDMLEQHSTLHRSMQQQQAAAPLGLGSVDQVALMADNTIVAEWGALAEGGNGDDAHVLDVQLCFLFAVAVEHRICVSTAAAPTERCSAGMPATRGYQVTHPKISHAARRTLGPDVCLSLDVPTQLIDTR